MPRPVVSVLILALGLAIGSCSDPTEPPASQPPDPPPTEPPAGGPSITSLHISGTNALVLHESALYTVSGLTAAGYSVTLPQPPIFASSDSSIAAVSAAGVVTGLQRGRALITARFGSMVAGVALTVRARVRIEPAYAGNTYWPMDAGDTLQFTASLVDVNGVPTEPASSFTWSSSNPTVSVSPTGTVISSQVNEAAIIRASTSDESDSVVVVVSDVLAGQPAAIRFAHAALGVGPITFTPGRGDPVTLTYGQSVERPVTSGTLIVQTGGLPGSGGASGRLSVVIRGGDHLSLFALGASNYATVASVWTTPVSVAPDSGLVRLVQGWGPYGVVYVRPTGAPADGLPEQCYFDPTSASPYYPLAPGGFDLILQQKYGGPAAPVRLAETVPAGHAVTMVLVGDSPATAGVVTFPDF